MVPPATERAATAAGGRDSSWNFSLARGALSTDWAWYLRAAILGDAAVGVMVLRCLVAVCIGVGYPFRKPYLGGVLVQSF